jgi:HNH endonuclease
MAQLVTQELLQSLLDYEPKSGKLFWKERPLEGFRSEGSWRAFNKKYAGKEAFLAQHVEGYFYGTILGERWLAHRVIWLLVTGEWPWIIDHINRNKTDNRFSNLRNGNYTQNGRNRPLSTKNKSGISGVWYNPKTNYWVVNIHNKYLGRYRCFVQAIKIRKAAEQTYDYHPHHGRPV